MLCKKINQEKKKKLSNATDTTFSQQYWVGKFLLVLIWTHHLLHFIIYHLQLDTSALLWKCCIRSFIEKNYLGWCVPLFHKLCSEWFLDYYAGEFLPHPTLSPKKKYKKCRKRKTKVTFPFSESNFLCQLISNSWW